MLCVLVATDGLYIRCLLFFLLLIPVRNLLRKKWFDVVAIIVLIVIYFLDFLPEIFAINRVFHFMVFFILGFMLNESYPAIKTWALKYWWLIYMVFIIINLALINILVDVTFVFRFVCPLTGTLAVMTMAFQLEKVIEKSKVAQYIEYCGKYSLQFYLFTFCYPLIRILIVSVLHVTSPFVILISVFLLQLITITVIVEITRRIKWLKIPCGY